MTKELRGIIEKMVSENPDIMQIATDWSPSNIGTTIWVQFPSIEDQELANQFMEKYTDYVMICLHQITCMMIAIL